jgi:hypothetical protein
MENRNGTGQSQTGQQQAYFHGEPQFGYFVDHTVMGNSVFTMIGRIAERGMLKGTKKQLIVNNE